MAGGGDNRVVGGVSGCAECCGEQLDDDGVCGCDQVFDRHGGVDG